MDKEELVYKKPKRTWLSILYGSVFIVLLFFLLIIVVFNVKYISAPVSGPSMQPTLNTVNENNGDTIYVNRFADYGLGDIVVIQSSSDSDKYIIKRVIAMEGDTICIYNDGTNYVLERSDSTTSVAHIVKEDYIKSVDGMATTFNNLYDSTTGLISSDKWSRCFTHDDDTDRYYFTVPTGTIFVLGDNRANSNDSSKNGPYDLGHVVGKVEHVVKYGESKFWYFVKDFFGVN